MSFSSPATGFASVRRVLTLVLVLLLSSAPNVARSLEDGGEQTLVGRSLADALLILRNRGLELIFTTEVVKPEMRVESEPASEDLPAILRDLLAPHGLAVEEGPRGVLVVVRDPDVPRGDDGRVSPGERPLIDDEIIVRPSEVSLLEAEPEGPFAFSRRELETVPHLGGDAFRAMPLVPGTATNDVTARFSVRGGRPDEVLIRLDGQELYEPYHLKDYESALSIVPTGALARATLTTGGFPASRGDRMGGVLDLRTPEPAAPRRSRLGIGATRALAASSGGLPGKLGGWSLTARRGSADLVKDLIGDESPKFWDAFARVDLTPREGHSLSLRGLVSDDELNLQENSDEETERFETDYGSRYAWMTHEGILGRRTLLETRASWASTRRDRRGDEAEEEESFAIRDRRRMDVLGLFQSASLEVGGDHVLELGWEARRFEAEFDYEARLDRELVVFAPFSSSREEELSFQGTLEGDHVGVWLSDRFGGFDRLTAEVGVRFDRHTLTDDTLWSPRLNAAWRLDERSLLRASWGRFHQSQRPYELLVEDGQTALQPAERADHWVLGYERLLGTKPGRSGAFRVEAFRREIDKPRVRWENLLEPINVFPEIEPDRVRIAPDRAIAEGIEILLRGSLGTLTSGWLAYTWSESRQLFEGREIPRSLDQTHAVVAYLGRPLGRHWHLALAWHYHTGWPTTPVVVPELGEAGDDQEPELGLAFGDLHSERLPDYHRLDLRVSRSWQVHRSTLRFFIDVQNAYDRRNIGGFDPDFDEDKRTVELDPEPWPGILPSFGVVWEF